MKPIDIAYIITLSTVCLIVYVVAYLCTRSRYTITEKDGVFYVYKHRIFKLKELKAECIMQEIAEDFVENAMLLEDKEELKGKEIVIKTYR